MRRVSGKTETGETRYFNSGKHEVGEWYQSWRNDQWFIITSVGEGEAVDEYGDVDRGWFHTMREATAEEIAEHDRQQAEWEALTPEERTEERLNTLSQMLPNLDWGFDKGFGIGGLGRHIEEPQQVPPDESACVGCGHTYPQSHLSNGACPDCSSKCSFCKGFFPKTHLMSASMGTACPDCYDRASDAC